QLREHRRIDLAVEEVAHGGVDVVVVVAGVLFLERVYELVALRLGHLEEPLLAPLVVDRDHHGRIVRARRGKRKGPATDEVTGPKAAIARCVTCAPSRASPCTS